MLQLQTKSVNIGRISKLLVKYNIKASVTNQIITLDGDISEELLIKICDSIDIQSVQNYIEEEPLNKAEEILALQSEESIKNESVEEIPKVEIPQIATVLPNQTSEYDLIYSVVKRGEVYLCDFGEPYGYEQGLMRYAIVVQNDYGNLNSPTTIVVPCTTKPKKQLPVHLNCTFSSENMIDYDFERVGSEENVIITEQIRTVDKRRLRKYIGKLTSDFMKFIDSKIEVSLNLNKSLKKVISTEKVYAELPVSVSEDKMIIKETQVQRKDVNTVQIQLLSLVDINELLKISQSEETDQIKVEKILKLYGFDLNKNGVQYLLKAIINSPKDTYFNLETLSEEISIKEGVEKEEVKRLIVARVKETFGFKKSPTIDFIRLVNNFIKTGGQHEKTNV